jgi:hypothetical protein
MSLRTWKKIQEAEMPSELDVPPMPDAPVDVPVPDVTLDEDMEAVHRRKRVKPDNILFILAVIGFVSLVTFLYKVDLRKPPITDATVQAPTQQLTPIEEKVAPVPVPAEKEVVEAPIQPLAKEAEKPKPKPRTPDQEFWDWVLKK